MKKRLFVNIFFGIFYTLCCFQIIAQNGMSNLPMVSNFPEITHFTQSEFKGDSQFWTMCRDNEGVYYFGNNDGVLLYDGERWEKVVLPNSSAVRSLYYASNGKVYAGGFNEFGTIEKDAFGTSVFKSLNIPLSMENKNLGNFWQIHEIDKNIIFKTFEGLIVVSETSATFVPALGTFGHAEVIDGRYYIQDGFSGVMTFELQTGRLFSVFDAAVFKNLEIVAFLPAGKKDEIEIVINSGVIYRGNTKLKILKKRVEVFPENTNETISAAVKKEGSYVLGTVGSKIILLNSEGEQYDAPAALTNLQDATVHGLYLDGKNLWALLNNGIDFINYNPISSTLFNGASVYDLVYKNNSIYLATNKGVYRSALTNDGYWSPFDRLNSPLGQTWSFLEFDDAILVSHDKGLFRLKENSVVQIGKEAGFWKVIPIPYKTNWFLACSYNGFFLLEKSASEFKIVRKIGGFDESARDVLAAEEDNTFWVCHGYKGVYKLRFDDVYSRVVAIDHFTDNNGLQTPFNINVHKWNTRTLFTTNTGIYTYDKLKKQFETFTPLNKFLDPTINTRKIIEYRDTTWVVLDDEIGFFKTSEKEKKVVKKFFLDIKGTLNRGLEYVRPLGNDQVMIGNRTGLKMYNLKQSDPIIATTSIARVMLKGDLSKEFYNLELSSANPKIPTTTNIIRFEFASPNLAPASDILYSYKLPELDESWSEWSETPYKEYTHLKPGSYDFEVKSMDVYGREANKTTYSFTIIPKWYETNLAYTFYALLILLLLWSVLKFIKNIITVEKRKTLIAAKKSERLLQLEIQELKLKQDKSLLEESLLSKSKELTNYTRQLIDKKHVFNEIQDDLKELKNLISKPTARQKVRTIFQKLHQHKIGEEYLKVYDVNFEKVNQHFFEKLLERNPKLTKRELRLCAFVKMNLSNKEIAPLMNISIRGVETARYRIRKKIDIQHESNFYSFLVEL